MKMSVLDVLLAFAVIGAAVPVLCDRFIILSTATSNCPGELTGEVCVTLEQYVYNPSQSSEITLLLEPGLHSLPTNFEVSSSTQTFSMTSAGAAIACDTRSLFLTFTSVENINITGISFKGCGGLLIEEAVTLHFTDVAIMNSGPASYTPGAYTLRIENPLVPNPLRSAVLRNVTFLNNSHQSSITYMYNIVFERVTYINSKVLTVLSKDGSTSNSIRIGTVHRGPQATFTMSHSLYSLNEHEMRLHVDKVYISNSTFVDNRRSSGLHASEMNLTIDNSVFTRNRGGLSGILTNVTMINCTFNSNTDTALSITQANILKLQNSIFINNAGGLYYLGLAMMVTGCTFDSNRATNGGAMRASPLYSLSVITSRNAFINNSAAVDGGALHYSGQGYTSVSIHSTSDVFRENNASVSGGAIYSNVSGLSVVLSVRNSTFYNNVAMGNRGGAVYSAGVNTVLSFVGSTFDSNSAPSCGVMDASNHISVQINSSSFTNNVATGEVFGGGVACFRNTLVSIRNATFTYNRANLHAGVFHVDNSSVSISDSTFLGNSAAADGGVMYTRVISAEYSISHSVFSYNSAGQSGGVMYLNREGSQATVTESIISYNRAANRGGAFNVIGSSLNINGSNIYNNTADIGSVISACNSVVQVQELNSSIDSTHPSCELYEGFINTFNIVPPHDFNVPVATIPQSSPSTTSSPQQTGDYLPTGNTLLTSVPPTSTGPTSTGTPSSTSTMETFPSQLSTVRVQSRQAEDEIKHLTIIVYTFAAIIVVLILCVIALSVKVIYDCVRSRLPKYQQVHSISLEAVSKLP